MKNKNIILVLVVTLFTGVQSCNFLNVDDYFLDTMSEDSIFASKLNAKKYLFNVPLDFPDPGKIWGGNYTPGELASDEMTANWRTDEFPGMQFTVGLINSEKLKSLNIWGKMYKIIARCNYMLANVDDVPDMTTSDKVKYKAYVHFIRGWAYYHLLQNWGPLYIVGDEVYTAESKPADFNKGRETYHKSVDYICNEFEIAGKSLPEKVTIQQFGRPTKGAAYALIARLRLQQASPTFNGSGNIANKYFAPWKTEKGEHFISQKKNDSLYAKAAFACKRVIDMKQYQINAIPLTPEELAKLSNKIMDSIPKSVRSEWPLNFPDGPNGINPYKSYKHMFDGEMVIRNIKEFIWAVPYSGGVTQYTRHSFPVALEGYGGMSIPQRVVDAFYMKDGKTIKDATSEYPYNYLTKDDFSKDEINYWGYVLPREVYGMYCNREARFYANVGFSRRKWTMYSCLSDEPNTKNTKVEYETPNNNGRQSKGNNINPEDYTSTGYVPVKYINASDAYLKGSVEPKPFAIIRLAEIYLGYVEALNELEGKSFTITGYDPTINSDRTETLTRNTAEMQKYFNIIRFRAGLPGLKVIPARDEMFEKLKTEYQIEFFNENRRYFDTRRWGIYIDDDNKGRTAWKGMDINATDVKEYYNNYAGAKQIDNQNIRDRKIEAKMLWLPLPHDELMKIPDMEQNYGWDK